MRTNQIKQKLRAGGASIGAFMFEFALGIPGQFEHPDFQHAVDRVLTACRRHGKTPGFMASDIAGGKRLLDQGFRMLAYGGDLWLYQTALRAGVDSLTAYIRSRAVLAEEGLRARNLLDR